MRTRRPVEPRNPRELREGREKAFSHLDAALMETKAEISPSIILDTAIGDALKILQRMLGPDTIIDESKRQAVIDLMKVRLFETGRVAEGKMELGALVIDGTTTIKNIKKHLEGIGEQPEDFAICLLSPTYYHETMHLDSQDAPNTNDPAHWPGPIFTLPISRGPLDINGKAQGYTTGDDESFADKVAKLDLPEGTRVIIADENLGTGGTVFTIYQALKEGGYDVAFAGVGFNSGVKGQKLKGELPVVENFSRYDTVDERTICKSYGVEITPSTEIADSTINEGTRAGDGKKRTILAHTHEINSSFFRRLEKMGSYSEYILDALINEKIKYEGLKEIAQVDTFPISDTLLVNDSYFMREIADVGFDADSDVVDVLEYMIKQEQETVNAEQREKENRRREYYHTTLEREGKHLAVAYYDDIDGSTVAEAVTDEDGYVQFVRGEDGEIVRVQRTAEPDKFVLSETGGLGPEREHTAWLQQEEINISKTSTRSIEECMHVLDLAGATPEFLGAEDGNVCWIKQRLSESTLLQLRKSGYIVQDLGEKGTVVHTRKIKFDETRSLTTGYPKNLDTALATLRERFPRGNFIESSEAIRAYEQGDDQPLREANRILGHPAGDIEYTRRALTRYGSRLLITEDPSIRAAYAEISTGLNLHTADYGPNNPVICCPDNDKSLPVEVYSKVLSMEYGLDGVVIESRLNASNDVRFALKATEGTIEGVEARVHFLSAGKIRPEDKDTVEFTLGEKYTVVEHDGEYYLFKITPDEYEQLSEAGIDFVFAHPNAQAFEDIRRQTESSVLSDREELTEEKLLRGVHRARAGELFTAVDRYVRWQGAEQLEQQLSPSVREAMESIEKHIRDNGDTPITLLMDNDGTAYLTIDPEQRHLYTGPLLPGEVVQGEPPLQFVRDLRISPDQARVWTDFPNANVRFAILSGRSSEDLAATYAAALENPSVSVFSAKGRAKIGPEGEKLANELVPVLENDPLRQVANHMIDRIIEMFAPEDGSNETIRMQLLAIRERVIDGDRSAAKSFEKITGYRISRQEIDGKTVLLRLHHLYRACQLAEHEAKRLRGIANPRKVDRVEFERWLQSEDGSGVLAQLGRENAEIMATWNTVLDATQLEQLNVTTSDAVGHRSFCQDQAPNINTGELFRNMSVILYAGDNPEAHGDDRQMMDALRQTNPDSVLMAITHDQPYDPETLPENTVQGSQFDLFLMQYLLAKRLEQ